MSDGIYVSDGMKDCYSYQVTDGLGNIKFIGGHTQTRQCHGNSRFYQLLEECAQTHSDKSHDYTPADDPLANFKRSERLGVPAWKGCLVRMGDKYGRLEQLAAGKEPKNESLRDTLKDLAIYSLLCVLLLEDAK